MARILSIQSHVAFGHVGNAAVTFPLQVLGHEVWPVPTAVLSNHAGYPDMGGARLEPGLIADMLAGLDARGALAACDVLLTGYLGAEETGGIVTDFVDRLRAANEDVLYCCDPVMGDHDGGLYVSDGLRRYFIGQAVPMADVMTPNLFELEALAALPDGALHGRAAGDIARAARGVMARMRPGGRLLVTSVVASDLAPDGMAMMALDAQGAWTVQTPRLAFTANPHGAGDLASGLFAADLAGGGDAAGALAQTAARLFAVLAVTAHADGAELDLVGAQADLRNPPRQFDPQPVE